jgi:hypothetical protein
MSFVNLVLKIDAKPPRSRGPLKVYAKIERDVEDEKSDDRIVFQAIELTWFDSMESDGETLNLEKFVGARFFTIKVRKTVTARFSQVLARAMTDNDNVWFQIDFLWPKKFSDDPAMARIFEYAEKPAWNLRIASISIPKDAAQEKLLSVFQLTEQNKVNPKDGMRSLDVLHDPFVVAYDVGQGAANGIHAAEGRVAAYFDFGGGTTTHAKTYPIGLSFCFATQPIIFLSHWHSDHWISATKHDKRALKSTWIVPEQTIGPFDLVLILAIEHEGGSVIVVPSSTGLITAGPITIGTCTGTNRNESGLAMLVRTESGEVLLSGDCGYEHLPDFWNGATTAPELLGLTVPHHGGLTTRLTNKATPTPLGGKSKLAFSYGKPNRYKHPRKDVENTHIAAGWSKDMMRETPARRDELGHVALSPGPPIVCCNILPCGQTCTLRATQ